MPGHHILSVLLLAIYLKYIKCSSEVFLFAIVVHAWMNKKQHVMLIHY